MGEQNSKEDVSWLQGANSSPRRNEGGLDHVAQGERKTSEKAPTRSEETREAREKTESPRNENGGCVKKHKPLFSCAKKHYAVFFCIFSTSALGFRLLFPHKRNSFIRLMTNREHKCARLFMLSVVLNVSDESFFFTDIL